MTCGNTVTLPHHNGGTSKAFEIVNNGMSLAGFFRRYPDNEAAEAQFEACRWPDGVRCAHCESANVATIVNRRPQPHRCRRRRKHLSVKVNGVMHGSKLGAHTWLLGLFLILANPKGRSSVQLAQDLGITQKSAWHVAHRIRKAMRTGAFPGLAGPLRLTRPTLAEVQEDARPQLRITGRCSSATTSAPSLLVR